MARINNYRRISLGDFAGNPEEAIRILSEILNPFMREVTDEINGGLDFENLAQNILTLDVTVDSSGKPLSNQINTGILNPQGFQVIRVINNTNASLSVDGQPFISFTPLGNGIVNVSKISNLVANNNYSLIVIVY
jgi:hypothetical protein